MGRKCKDYTGQICGCWKVIERDFNPTSSSHETFWKAECQNCGTIASVRKTDLDRKPQFCNNCKGEQLRGWQIGDRFGLLTIIDRGRCEGGHSYVKVQCDCGSEPFEVRIGHLKGQNHSKTISCGCVTESAGELKICRLLEQQDINFQKQYRLKNDKEEWMVFDFVIFNAEGDISTCIEYNGEQHYKPVDIFGGEEQFRKQQIRDQHKTDYCNTHHINLIWIPYWEYDNINLEMLELSSLKNEN